MKIPPAKIDGFVRSPPKKIRAFLLFGPDAGMVAAHANSLALQVVPNDQENPFNRVRIFPEDLKDESSRITDELSATTLLGGQRVISCVNFTERERPAVEVALQAKTGVTNRLIVCAGDLKPSSKLRKLFEMDETLAALACYADENKTLTEVIRSTLASAGMEADRDALAALNSTLGGDRSVTMRELEKLILYKGEPGRITSNDVAVIVSDAAPLGIDKYLFAITAGNLEEADNALHRLLEDGQSPVRLHNSLAQHLARFCEVLVNSSDINKASNALKPPLFWKVKDKFISQAKRMRPNRLIEAVRSSNSCGLDLRLSPLPPELVLSRLTLRLSQLFK